jgi:CheY-like chemotaxis protein
MDINSDTILVVDDNPINVEILQALLAKEGYFTSTASGGRQCLNIVENESPNLILLDVDMPDMNGFDVCKTLKRAPSSSEIPVIFVTGLTDNKTITEAFESGGTDYIRKPINRAELLARVKSVLSRQKYRNSLLEKERLVGVLEMAGAVCHELNQPLQVIQLYSDAIAIDLGLDANTRESLEQIKKQSSRMGKITKKIMHITKYASREYLEGVRIVDIERASSALY